MDKFESDWNAKNKKMHWPAKSQHFSACCTGTAITLYRYKLADSWQLGYFGNFTLDTYLFDPSTALGLQWSMQEFWESFSSLLLSLSLGFFSLYVEFADFARFRRRVRSSLFVSVAAPLCTCEGVFWKALCCPEPVGCWLEAWEGKRLDFLHYRRSSRRLCVAFELLLLVALIWDFSN